MGSPGAAVVGLGRSGQAAAQLLTDSGYQVVGFDQKVGTANSDFSFPTVVEPSADDLGRAIVALSPDVVVVSPGIPETSPLLTAPRAAGIEVIGEVQLAWNLSQAGERDEGMPTTSWLCVTGTNGKTTTVGMLASILKEAGLRAGAVGNVGYPITAAMSEPFEAMAVELSSFQLATSRHLHPTAAICLNVATDHLDWHGGREAYARAKSHVYDGVSVARFFFQDERETEAMARQAKGASSSALVPLTFGDVPSGAIGIEGQVVLDRSGLVGQTPDVLADFANIPLLAATTASDNTQSDSADPMVRDALAAVALARAEGVAPEAIQRGLERFRPDAHRREKIATHGDVTWVDDSKATNVHAAIAAAKALTPGTVVWILGGDAKGQDLRPLARAAGRYARAVAVIGADAEGLVGLLSEEASETPVRVIRGTDAIEAWMMTLVRACAEMASPGDTVLLAPGCASWDQFDSYAQRGDAFKHAVMELSAGGGE